MSENDHLRLAPSNKKTDARVKRTRERDALLLAARECCREFVGMCSNRHAFEQCKRAFATLAKGGEAA